MNCANTERMTTKFFLFLTILLAPLYVVRFSIGPYPSTLLEVLIGLTVVAWLVGRVREKGVKGIKGISAPTALFLAAAAISVIVSPDKRGALGSFKAYFIEPLLIYFIIKNVVKSKKDWRLAFSALVFSGLWVALLAVFQGLTGQFAFTPHEALQGRAHAVYNTANAVGLYLGPIIMLLIGVVWKFRVFGGRKGKLFIIHYSLFILMILAIILSKSVGAVVGLGVGLVLLGGFRVFREFEIPKRMLFIVHCSLLGLTVLVLIVGIWFFLNISNFTPKNVDPYVRKSADTFQFRLCLWEGTRDLLLDKPVFGAGLSGFKELYSQKYFTCDAEPLEYPHNLALNFWAETGILGLVVFFGILVVYFKNIKYQISNIKYRWLALGFAAAMIYWLIHGLVDVPYFKNDLALEFWVIVGLAETLGFAF